MVQTIMESQSRKSTHGTASSRWPKMRAPSDRTREKGLQAEGGAGTDLWPWLVGFCRALYGLIITATRKSCREAVEEEKQEPARLQTGLGLLQFCILSYSLSRLDGARPGTERQQRAGTLKLLLWCSCFDLGIFQGSLKLIKFLVPKNY